jgi:plasmid stabilization system protein ParE
MNFTTRLHPAARKEYIEAYIWYETKQKGLGERFMRAIRGKIESLSEHPETYSSKSRADYREAAAEIFPYIIVYKIYKSKKEIFISAIYHTSRHPKRKYRR